MKFENILQYFESQFKYIFQTRPSGIKKYCLSLYFQISELGKKY